MPIDRLTSTSALISALRSDVLRKMEQRPSAQQSERAPQPAAAKRPGLPQLRTELMQVVRNVNLDEPGEVRQARHRFVRAILLWEFGDGFRDHPEWRPLMDHIEGALDSDHAQNARFTHLLTTLKSSRHK